MSARLIDKFGRVHDYVRISVTDHCNFRCVYCMPAEGMEFRPGESLLTYDEIAETVRVLAEMGVRKVRLTGGEPLTRPNLEGLVAKLNAIPGIRDISLTTNGIFLPKKAVLLREAGLNHVNISLDSMNPERFTRITRGGDVGRVLDAVDACIDAGYNPVKLNVVLMNGINDDEIESFLRLTLERPLHVRFIEYMPIGQDEQGWRDSYLPLNTVLERCIEAGWSFEPVEEKGKGNGPAQYFRIAGAMGLFGLIHPVSDHFCTSCNRLRLTAEGSIKPCLYWNDEWSVRKWIGNDDKLKELFLKALDAKPETHDMAKALSKEEQCHTPRVRRMSQIGG